MVTTWDYSFLNWFLSNRTLSCSFLGCSLFGGWTFGHLLDWLGRTLASLCSRAFPNLLGRRALGSLLCRLLHNLLSLGLVIALGTACGTCLYLLWRRFLGHCFTFSSLLHNFLLWSLSLLFHHLNLLLGLLGLLSSNLGNLVGTGALPFFSSQDKCLRLQSSPAFFFTTSSAFSSTS